MVNSGGSGEGLVCDICWFQWSEYFTLADSGVAVFNTCWQNSWRCDNFLWGASTSRLQHPSVSHLQCKHLIMELRFSPRPSFLLNFKLYEKRNSICLIHHGNSHARCSSDTQQMPYKYLLAGAYWWMIWDFKKFPQRPQFLKSSRFLKLRKVWWVLFLFLFLGAADRHGSTVSKSKCIFS